MMKMLLATAVTGLLAMPAFAGGVKYAYHNQGKAHPTGNVIHVSCYRGPWNDVIWDRPNSVFVDSLVAVGYDFSTAHAVAERVCRDHTLVGNPEGLKATMKRIFADAASHRKHNY
ncbi:MAG: hypothetical protein ABJN39_05770 [Sulfitobacter sp.]|jgi:hypothetical protein|uniref:hypothetical protein n=1 Tax=Sulfitobacter TaxID=60136 RepID=UPI0007C374C1|nr:MULTISPECIES: hypothetical protein [Sulfitobacter]KZZ24749.1 hypothetical protein A3753_16345 [Sulfitobacter sp. HI0082]AYE85652.1 hypothetical protein B5M07_05640 [Sulfitobacter sp. D7]KZX95902.1 hypothetical protein A3720_03610 [Sulfitobacter sp. HI0021]KZY00508.1 hypothetical protein A3722_10320 [Sulfitobacter sp. HI0027]KZZ03658.1 hypothetical protein A3747_10765 [Sulfitobacter sp. HI0076]|tara:strand:- start:866 stop:1210 length:345 start_codon:yes stop_codon:yes gene_type:complete